MATLSSAPESQHVSQSDHSRWYFYLGISILFLAAVLSSIMGLISESLFRTYGRHWRENLFYTHLLSLPFFIPIMPQILFQFEMVMESKPSYLLSIHGYSISLPILLVYLIGNGITQFICVRGVNQLAGSSTALTVNVVLNVRKFVSLFLSIYLFNNHISTQMIIGTILVFSGAFIYSSARSNVISRPRK